MIVIMKPNATAEQVEVVVKRIKKEEEENEKVIVMENIIHGIN